MWDLIQKGGWVMYPILAGSVLGLGLFFERLWVLQRRLINPPNTLHHLLNLIQNMRWIETRVVCQRVHNPLTRIALAMLSVREKSTNREALRSAAEEAGQREAFFLERGVGVLGAVASIEPLLGLFGTVLGMIEAFRQVEIGGVGDPRVVAGGVWVALITTAVGLAIAIPAYLGYRMLLARVDRLVLDLQGDVSTLLDAMLITSSSGTPQPTGTREESVVNAMPAKSSPSESRLPSAGGVPKNAPGEGKPPNAPFLLPPDGESL